MGVEWAKLTAMQTTKKANAACTVVVNGVICLRKATNRLLPEFVFPGVEQDFPDSWLAVFLGLTGWTGAPDGDG